MIKIRGCFVRDIDGAWHNTKNIFSFYVAGEETVGYRICFSQEIPSRRHTKGYFNIGELHSTKESSQAQLDALMDALEMQD